MRITWRVVILLLIATCPLVLSGAAPILTSVVEVADFLIIAFTIADYALIPNPSSTLQIKRECAGELTLNSENIVTITVEALTSQIELSTTKIKLHIKDSLPDEFEVIGDSSGTIELVGKKKEAALVYRIKPTTKGDFSFGDIFIMMDGLFGLARREHKIDAAQSVKVYPSLNNIRKFDMLVQSGRIMQAGIHRFRFDKGGGEFESLRDYVLGDEYRKIDWSATAKRHKLITRQYEADRAQNIIIVLDAGRAMAAPIDKIAKIDYAIDAALMLAYMASMSDDRIGLLVFGAEEMAFLPPGKGRGQVYRLLDTLYNVSASPVESDYEAAFTQLAVRWKRRSLVVLMTDLIDPDSSGRLLKALRIIDVRHRVFCATVSDPYIEASAEAAPEHISDVYRRAVATQVLHERSQAISALRQRGVVTIDSPPETLSKDIVNHYLKMKSRSAI